MKRIPRKWYDSNCTRCPRLSNYLSETSQKYPEYHCRPVPPFGDRNARLLIVGLAPGLHGANATGRPFTGDHAGILLYETLFDLGIATTKKAISADDGLKLNNCRITNAVKCLPPKNTPNGSEINECNAYLAAELRAVPTGGVVVTLGGIAHRSVTKALSLKLVNFPFVHGANYALADGRFLLSSYHCSRYNTQTKRLTKSMLRSVFVDATSIAYGNQE
ncbi:MAG: SPO1 DNA polymerase [Acidiferrobacteraceae bacterium]|nr:SPO1 DNA polymerase [Acidiferrobacteraceae bacterium]|tara:strand:+ start:1021 stop:1677 length:657 start_codon:yes stop_codon:yes gene_type:complete